MKKFILGLACGIMVTASTAAFASGSIQALLFPAKFEINGNQVPMGTDYQVLNVDGHAYVPVRFVAENLGATIDYDSELQKIMIRNQPLYITDPDYKTISVGNLILTKDGDNTKVTGQLRFDGVGSTQNMIGAQLSFYNEDNVKIGEAPISGNSFGVKNETFVTEGKGDFKNYAVVYLHIGAVNHRVISEAPQMVYTNSNYHFSLNIPRSWEGKYEVKEEVDDASHIVGIHFINKANKDRGGVMFTISRWTKEEWRDQADTTKGITSVYKVGEDAEYVYLQFPPGDVEYNPFDEKLTEEYQSMTDQISKIRTSFKLLK